MGNANSQKTVLAIKVLMSFDRSTARYSAFANAYLFAMYIGF